MVVNSWGGCNENAPQPGWQHSWTFVPAASGLSCVAFMVGAPISKVRTPVGPGYKPEGQVPGPEPQTNFRACCHTSAPLSPVAEVLSECRLLAYISQVPTQMSFLFRLINIIHVQTLTQVRGPADMQEGKGDWK